MSDRILLDRIRVFARHGVLPEEAERDQPFLISLDCAIDLAPAGRSDDLARTVSYAELAALAVEIATTRRFALIEALAEAIASAVLGGYPAIAAVTVRIDKPEAPIPAPLVGVAVEITRRRAG